MMIETKRKTIEIKRENKINGGKKAFILFGLIISITLYNHYIKNFFPLLYAFEGLIYIVSFLGVLYSLNEIISPLSKEDEAFMLIINAMDILKNTHAEVLREEAYKKIVNASKKLEEVKSLESDHASWYSKPSEIEKKFTHNLRLRIAPAIRDDKLNPMDLQAVALFFINSDINQIDKWNKEIEEKHDEIEYEGKITPIFTNIYNNKIGRLFVMIIFSLFLTIMIGYFSSTVFNEEPMTFFRNNYQSLVILAVGIMAMPMLYDLFKIHSHE